MKRILYLITLVLPLYAYSQSWEEANEAYAEGNYDEAIAAYNAVLQVNASDEAYYNLGNAYFKTGEIAQAILAYERCLRINPRHKDAKFNLAFASARITDNVEDKETFFLLKWARNMRDQLSQNHWLIISFSAFLFCIVCLFIFAFASPLPLRKTAFWTSCVSIVITIIGVWCGLSLHSRDTTRAEAIIMQGVVNVKASPDKSGTDLFVLHEGTKVRISDNVGEWCQIHAGDNIGWVKQASIERI